jgi:hypothetical protein
MCDNIPSKRSQETTDTTLTLWPYEGYLSKLSPTVCNQITIIFYNHLLETLYIFLFLYHRVLFNAQEQNGNIMYASTQK